MSIYSHCTEELARFDALLGEANDLDDREALKIVVSQAIRLTESLTERFPDDADAHQMLGLAWYHHPSSSSWRSWHCRGALERALSIEPEHPFALRYLAYLTFDQERYPESLDLLKRLCRLETADLEADQEWRALKDRELALVCRMRVDPGKLPEKDFATFAARFKDAHEREKRDLRSGSVAWPQELRECAEWLFVLGSSPEEDPLRRLLSFLREVGSTDGFWNRGLQQAVRDGRGA